MKIVIVEKTGTVKTQNVKNFEIETLYKKCLFRKPDDFHKRHVWTVKINNKTYNIALFAKSKGKATTENKYDLPPPVDDVLYYGSMALVNFDVKEGDETDASDLTSDIWEKIYEKLFGGFEDIENTDDEEEEDELANVPKKYLTKKGGYLKDGFVVDTTSDEDTYESDESKHKSSKHKLKNENTVIKVKTNGNADKKNTVSEINTGSDISDVEISEDDNDDDIIVMDDNDDNQDNDCDNDSDNDGNESDGNGGDSDGDDCSDDDSDDDSDKDNSQCGDDSEDGGDDDSYIAGSDSDDSDNSSELSESVYCEYSDED